MGEVGNPFDGMVSAIEIFTMFLVHLKRDYTNEVMVDVF